MAAPVFPLKVREPVRGGLDAPATQANPPSFAAVLALLARKRAFWWLALGSATASMAGYGLMFWMPSFIVRSHGLDLLSAARVIGGVMLNGRGCLRIWAGGLLADRLGARRKAAYALVPAVAFVVTVPLYVAGVLSTSLWTCVGIMLLPTALSLAWLGPVTSAIQHLVPASMRTTTSAIFLFINNLIGLGLGTTLIGLLSDALRLRFGTESLRYAVLAVASFYLLAALFYVLAARRIARDWEG